MDKNIGKRVLDVVDFYPRNMPECPKCKSKNVSLLIYRNNISWIASIFFSLVVSVIFAFLFDLWKVFFIVFAVSMFLTRKLAPKDRKILCRQCGEVSSYLNIGRGLSNREVRFEKMPFQKKQRIKLIDWFIPYGAISAVILLLLILAGMFLSVFSYSLAELIEVLR